MDKFSYSIGLGIGQNLSSMGIGNLAVDDFAQAIKDVLEGNQTAISHNEAREIVNKYFEELEAKMGAVAIEQGQAFLEENKKGPGVVVLPSGLQYEIIKEGTGKKPKATDQVRNIDRRYTVRQLYPTRRTGCIRCQPSNPGMGGSFTANAGRF
jgi:FKBP-type peptidyl-prolyl cis-trans isomerase FklB